MPPTWSDEGLAVAEEIRRRFPQVGVLLLSQYVEAEYALRLLDGGSERIGYLLKERVLDIDDLVAALRARRRGRDGRRPGARLATPRPRPRATARSTSSPRASAKSSR